MLCREEREFLEIFEAVVELWYKMMSVAKKYGEMKSYLKIYGINSYCFATTGSVKKS